MKTAKIEAYGKTESDFESALTRAVEQVENGFTSGGEHYEHTGYTINVDGECEAEVDHTVVNQLSREQIVLLLENVSIACYDRESTDELREALVANVEDGTIPWEHVVAEANP